MRSKYAVKLLLGVLLSLILNGCSTSPHPPSILFNFLPHSISMLNAQEGWIVGSYSHVGTNNTVALHHHNGSWSRIPVPTEALFKVVELAANDVWAMNNAEGMYHYDGQQWISVGAATDTIAAQDFTMISPTEGWAVGLQGFLHYINGSWRIVPATTGQFLKSISMTSAQNGWAVGAKGVIEHFDGVQWTEAASPVVSQTDRVDLKMVKMVSASEGWAVGTVNFTSGIILHYTSNQWTIVKELPAQPLDTVVMTSSSSGWIGGFTDKSQHVDNVTIGNQKSLLLRYNNGMWNEESSPDIWGINDISMGNPDDGWAIGDQSLLHFKNDTWSLYTY